MPEHHRPSVTQGFTSPFTNEPAPESTRLFVLAGPISGASFVIDREEATIGREAACAICVPSKSVSKLHCTIHRESDDRFVIIDEGSTNGTQVNGRALEPHVKLQLTNGDTVTIGETMMIFVNGGGAGQAGQPEQIRLDTSAVAKEAREMIDAFAEASSLARARRERNA